MNNTDFSGSADITDEGIRKHFRNYDAPRALFELIWNGFDAEAINLRVNIQYTELGAVNFVSVLDDGNGIDFHHSENNFCKFNDSNKRGSADQHGSHGRGRLAFCKMCNDATWYTRFNGEDAIIKINGARIKNFSGAKIPAEEQIALLSECPKGTCVELRNFRGSFPSENLLAHQLSDAFGWYLALNRSRSLELNGVQVEIPEHEISTRVIVIGSESFKVDVVRWDRQPSSEKSHIYLLNGVEKVVYKELSSLNNKADFFTSVCVSSSWADSFSNGGDNIFGEAVSNSESKVWRELNKLLSVFTQEVYEDFLRKLADKRIEGYVESGEFPEYLGVDPEYAKWKRDNIKGIIKTIFISDPSFVTSLKKKQRKVLIRLLDKFSVSSENESLLDILESVLDLDQVSLDRLAGHLKHTKLENIISSIEALQKRQIAACRLRELLLNHHKDVGETPDLQRIIESNTWLFGPQYETLGAEEQTFTKIVEKFRAQLREQDLELGVDIEEGATIPGANRQVDLFLARKILERDSAGNQFYRCIVVEIKKPSISLNWKHLQQLDDYARILKSHPEFQSDSVRIELILVGRKISEADTEIAGRIASHRAHNEPGLVMDDGKIKRYVRNWFSILDNFEITNAFMLKQLTANRDSIEEASKSELVSQLQKVTA